MTKKQALNILKKHNAWRRGEDIPMVEAKDIGMAIDKAIDVLKKEVICICEAPLIRTGNNGGEYCGICEKDIVDL